MCELTHIFDRLNRITSGVFETSYSVQAILDGSCFSKSETPTCLTLTAGSILEWVTAFNQCFFCVFDCDFFVSFQLTTPRLLRFSCLDLTAKNAKKLSYVGVMSLLDFSSQPWGCKSFMLWILGKKFSKNYIWFVWVYSCIFCCIWGIMNWWEMLFLLINCLLSSVGRAVDS